MAMEKKIWGLFLLVSLLLASQESMVEVEAATCAKPSKYYKGPCVFNDKGCAGECRKENWPGGKCTLSDVRCECQRPC